MLAATESPAVRRRRELRRYQQAAFVLAAIALAVGAALLPRGDELLLIHVKNRDIERARALLVEGTGTSVSDAASVMAHGELFQMEGRIDEALVELEAFAEKHPRDVDAWKRLSQMYADAQRLPDQVRAVGRVYELEPSTDTARRLLALYRWNADETAEAAILRDLVASGGATSDETIRSARLEAAFGRAAVACGALEKLRVREPGAFDYATAELYASLLVETKGITALSGPLQVLPVFSKDPEALARLSRTFTEWGRHDAAVALLDVPADARMTSERFAARAKLALDSPEAAVVVRDFVVRDAGTPMPDDSVAPFVDLALSIGDYASIKTVLENPHHQVASTLLSLVIGFAASHDARDVAQAFIARFGDSSLADTPMAALDLAVDRHDVVSADKWIAAVESSPEATAEELAAVARYDLRLGRTGRAFDRFVSLLQRPDAPDWAATEVANLASENGRVQQTLDLLASSPAPGARDAWVHLSVTNGDSTALRAWLQSSELSAADAAALRDAAVLLADRHEVEMARLAAERLSVVRGSDSDEVLLGRLLLLEGRAADAVAHLREAARADDEVRQSYDAALLQALQSGADVADELRQEFAARLADPITTTDQLPLLVEGLWAVGVRAQLAPHIVALAQGDLSKWLSMLVESAKAASAQDAARAVVLAALETETRNDATNAADVSIDRFTARPRTDLVQALIELDASNDVLIPQLRTLAYSVGGTWVFAYDERLAAESRTVERTELWTFVGRSSNADATERRAAASRLVELDERASAATILQDLASSSHPSDPDVLQLLYLWGQTYTDTQIAWLATRLQSASLDDQTLWMEHLLRGGQGAGARQVVGTVKTLPDEASAAFVQSWISAFQLAGNRQDLRQAIEQALARPSASLDELRHVARTALSNDLRDQAVRAFASVAEREPADLDANRWLGTLAFYDGRTEEARARLNAYYAAGGSDPEPLYQLGELALQTRDADLAHRYFSEALARFDDPSVAPNKALHANVLVRLGERARATAVFESALEEDPNRDHVRADFVSALFAWDDFRRAERVLHAAPRRITALDKSGATDASSDESGLRRLELLNVQWLTHEGRYQDVMKLLTTLTKRYPSDPDVLVARAAFDADRGRVGDAHLGFERAFQSAPQRTDIGRLVDQRARMNAPRASVETEARSISNAWDERSQRLNFDARLRVDLPVAFTFQQLDVRPAQSQLLVTSGASHKTVRRFEATTTVPVANAVRLTANLFATEGGVGGGLAAGRDDLRGRTEFIAEAGRPFWEFLETATADGRRDRVGASRQWRFRPDMAAWVDAGLNRYRVPSGPTATSSTLTIGFIRTVRRTAPSLTLQYGLDKESRLGGTAIESPDVPGGVRTIALSSREVHLFGAVSRLALRGLGELETTGGYTVDRLGGHGSFLTARVNPPLTAKVGVSAWFDRRVFALASTQQAVRTGLQMMVRF